MESTSRSALSKKEKRKARRAAHEEKQVNEAFRTILSETIVPSGVEEPVREEYSVLDDDCPFLDAVMGSCVNYDTYQTDRDLLLKFFRDRGILDRSDSAQRALFHVFHAKKRNRSESGDAIVRLINVVPVEELSDTTSEDSFVNKLRAYKKWTVEMTIPGIPLIIVPEDIPDLADEKYGSDMRRCALNVVSELAVDIRTFRSSQKSTLVEELEIIKNGGEIPTMTTKKTEDEEVTKAESERGETKIEEEEEKKKIAGRDPLPSSLRSEDQFASVIVMLHPKDMFSGADSPVKYPAALVYLKSFLNAEDCAKFNREKVEPHVSCAYVAVWPMYTMCRVKDILRAATIGRRDKMRESFYAEPSDDVKRAEALLDRMAAKQKSVVAREEDAAAGGGGGRPEESFMDGEASSHDEVTHTFGEEEGGAAPASGFSSGSTVPETTKAEKE